MPRQLRAQRAPAQPRLSPQHLGVGASPLLPSPSAAIGAFGCQSLDLGTRSGHCAWSRGHTPLTPLHVTMGLKKPSGLSIGSSALLGGWGEPRGALSSPPVRRGGGSTRRQPRAPSTLCQEPCSHCLRPGCHPGPPGPQAVPPSRAPLPAQWPGTALGCCCPLRHPTGEAHFQAAFGDGRARHPKPQNPSRGQEPRVVPALPHNW